MKKKIIITLILVFIFAAISPFAAGFFSAIAMGFSPTVFSSGQRTAFYTNMFVITACVALLSSVEKNKLTNIIYKSTVVYGVLTFSLNCFAFKLIEHPFMG